jgi:colanic acid/amylovoran biosynthesis protein
VVFLYTPKLIQLKEYIESFLTKGEIIGISVRNWLGREAQTIFETEIAKFIDELVNLGKKVVLVPQVSSSLHNDDDRVVQSRVFAKLLKPESCLNIQEVLNADEIWSIFSRCKLVVGTRMHAVLFSLCSGIPALALAYERKTWGVMQDLGLEAYVLDIEKVTAQRLLDLYTVLCDNIDSYIKQLQLAIPKQESLARLSAEVIFRNYPKNA